MSSVHKGAQMALNIDPKIRRDHQKNFLWVGRRKEPVLDYVPKNDEKKNLVSKGLKSK